MKLNEGDVLKIISKALVFDENKITIDSSSDNVPEWDSLGHLGILVNLDKAFEGKLAKIGDMATADSAREILRILKSHSLI